MRTDKHGFGFVVPQANVSRVFRLLASEWFRPQRGRQHDRLVVEAFGREPGLKPAGLVVKEVRHGSCPHVPGNRSWLP